MNEMGAVGFEPTRAEAQHIANMQRLPHSVMPPFLELSESATFYSIFNLCPTLYFVKGKVKIYMREKKKIWTR